MIRRQVESGPLRPAAPGYMRRVLRGLLRGLRSLGIAVCRTGQFNLTRKKAVADGGCAVGSYAARVPTTIWRNHHVVPKAYQKRFAHDGRIRLVYKYINRPQEKLKHVIRVVGELLVGINDEMIAAERRYIAAASVADLTDNPSELALPAAPRT